MSLKKAIFNQLLLVYTSFNIKTIQTLSHSISRIKIAVYVHLW